MLRIFFSIALVLTAGTVHAREIAITFDDAPMQDSATTTGVARTKMLIAALKAADIEQAAFFCVPRVLSDEGRQRLESYARAGHLLANHSNTHRNLRDITAGEYLADIAAADVALRTLPNFRPWFRFPYLSEGETRAKRDAVRTGLHAMNYRQGYVTVDTYDWYLDKLANDARNGGKALNQAGLRDLYVDVMIDSVEFYDKVALRALGRSPRHVLLLHENDLAAQFIGDLAAALRKAGWTIVSPEHAYADPISQVEPDTLFLGQGRVAAIAHTTGVPPRELVPESEEESILDTLFAARALQ